MTEREQIEEAIAAMEARRQALGDTLVDAAIAPLREKLAALDQQRKQVTVLFADMADFTATSGAMDPEDVRDMMQSYFERLGAAIRRQGGVIEKFIGDAIMAIFGIPAAHEHDPEHAVRAALDMQRSLDELNAELERERGLRLAIRIGVSTGPVLVSFLSQRQTNDWGVVGDTVNMASRLEHAAPPGGILISHTTYRHVRDLFDVQAMAPLTVKGKSEPVQVYLVRGLKPRTFRAPGRGIVGIATPMVGRAAELQALQAALDEVRSSGSTRIVTIVGEAGVGKSRLLEAFIDRVEQLPGQIQCFKGRAAQELGDRPYALIRDLFAFRLGIQDSDRAAVARQKLEQGIAGFLGPAAAAKAPFIGQLLGFDFSASAHLSGTLDQGRQIRDRAAHYLAECFAAAAAGAPAIVCLEDVHWADDSSLDMIGELARECRNVPLLMVGTARPTLFERRPAWSAAAEQFAKIELRPLSEQEGRRLIGAILRLAPETRSPLYDLVVGRAEGNPFYMEELLAMLIEDGVIVNNAGQWRIESERLAAIRVPPTLTGVLQARLDSLAPDERAVLQRASVVGRVFWDAAVDMLSSQAQDAPSPRATRDEADTLRTIAALCDKGLTIRRGAASFAGTQEYAFKHALLHEVIYESVLRRVRREHHKQVAEWLIGQRGERVGEYAGQIGHHFEHAGERVRAVLWYKRAARQAQEIYASETAIGYHRKVLALLPKDDEVAPALERAEAYAGLGEMLLLQARYDEAAAEYTALRAVADTAKDAIAQARARYGLAEVRQRQGEYRAALESAAQAERIIRLQSAAVDLSIVLVLKGWCCFKLNDTAAALALANEALLLATADDAARQMARAMNLIGAIQQSLGHYHHAAEIMKQALELLRDIDDRIRVGGTLNNLGAIAEALDDRATAARHYREALAVAHEIKDGELEALVLHNLARVERRANTVLGEEGYGRAH